jgi:multiple antibiotic resistance protein
MTMSSAALLLFLVMDPLGNIPLFLTALRSVPPQRQTRVVTRELVVAYVILLVFLFAGRYLLQLLEISPPALTIAGALVLFLIALRMVFPTSEGLEQGIEGEPFIVPLAIPYVAGPSALATVLLMMSSDPARWPEWLGAVTVAWLAGAVVLLLGSRLGRFLGRRGLIAIERLMGMLLVAIAVEMFLRGLRITLASRTQ